MIMLLEENSVLLAILVLPCCPRKPPLHLLSWFNNQHPSLGSWEQWELGIPWNKETTLKIVLKHLRFHGSM